MTKQVDLAAAPDTDGQTPRHFEILAYTGGKLRVDGFDNPVVVDLNGLEAEGAIPIAIKHDLGDATILGQTDPDQIINDGQQLRLGGVITADPEQSPAIRRVIAMANNGHKWQASIGAQIEESEEIPEGQTVTVNGRTLDGPFTLATRAVLRETSVLGMGADRHTSVTLSASVKLDLTADALTEGHNQGFEGWLDELGLEENALTERARNVLLQQYNAESRDRHDELDDAESESGSDDGLDAEEDMDAALEGADPDASDEEHEEDEEGEEPPKEKVKAKGAKCAGKTSINAKGSKTMTARQLNALAAKAANKLQADLRAAGATEQRRQAEINRICADDKILSATAIKNNWSIDKTKYEALVRANRKAAPAGHVRKTSPQDLLQALQGAMIIRAGGKIDHDVYQGDQAHMSSYINAQGRNVRLPNWLLQGVNTDARQKVMEAAWKFRDMSMVDLAKMCCQIDGIEADGSNQGFVRAAVSGGSLPDIFTTNINAILLQKLLEHPDTTAGWTKESDANNFQLMERTRLTKGPRLTLLGRGKDADNATRSDVMNSFKISRYAQTFGLDEQDMIDDRFEALQDIPNEMALASTRLRPDLVYTILLSNPTINNEGGSGALFSASQPGSQSNYVASGAALASATLQTAMATMFNIQENNVPINATPTHLIVPAALFGLAASLLQSPTIVVAGTAGTVTTKGTVNELQAMQEAWGLIKIVSDARLTNGVIDPTTGPAQTSYAGSSTKWYLASNKAPTIEVAYLRGAGRAPQVRQYVKDRGSWGMGWDVNLDIGAKAIDWHGLYCANQ
jgi:hypothetical protein